MRQGLQVKMMTKIFIYGICTFLVLACFAFSILNLSEYWQIVILKGGDGYPWGAVNDNPWFYESPGTYGWHCLMHGAVFLVAACALAISLFHKKLGRIAISAGLCILLLLLSWLSQSISA